ncbi:hypothetical protein ABT294_36845 [Nonomuraea sp. NPDC000554]
MSVPVRAWSTAVRLGALAQVPWEWALSASSQRGVGPFHAR